MCENLKLCVVGGGGVGKSSITVLFVKSEFVIEYNPTIQDSFLKRVHVDSKPAVLDILDTAGQEEFSGLRSSYMRVGQGFLIVYSVTNRSTFEEACQFREQIMRVHDRPDVPMILVGNKCDLETEREVSIHEGRALAKSLGCGFIECSAKMSVNVEETFFQLVRLIRQDQTRQANLLKGVDQSTDSKSKSKIFSHVHNNNKNTNTEKGFGGRRKVRCAREESNRCSPAGCVIF